MSDSKKPGLRSQDWFGGRGPKGFVHRAWVRSRGVPGDHFDGRPVIGICNTWSELTPCNSHFRDLAQYVREGVLEAGGVPMEFPVTSPGETLTRPTAMLLRNLTSMDVEETLRANPIDGVVLLMGCDKTTPALLMGAASVDLPTIGLNSGPMLNGSWRGKPFGIKDAWKLGDDVREGRATIGDVEDAESCLNRSHGVCNVMGTASTMASIVEAMGLSLPDNATIPAVDARRKVMARMVGRRIVDMVREDLTMTKIVTREAIENAVRVNAAVGGSTNAVIHLTAVARRLEVPLDIDDWDVQSRNIPNLLNIQPSGDYLMQDFHEAGGLPVIIRDLCESGLLHGDALTCTGKTLAENNAEARCFNPEVIFSVAQPFKPNTGIAVLKGNLAASGAVIKPSAASPHLLTHTGPALVFENQEDFEARVDDPSLKVTAASVLVLKNSGPKGFPGMPEVGIMRVPAKLLREGVSDIVRVSDARMSGTSFGTVVLHVSPESAVGGVLAVVQDGDLVELDVAARRLELKVPAEEIEQRLAEWARPAPHSPRGWVKLYTDTVNQAHDGADLDFLVGKSGSEPPANQH
ncbi:IlvD/Edd family dehydratase [Brevundimonas goettingensis]|uniref:Dihydroxy-acid dehydratase n=1 Tax=Brevundimonas goettingensis TaxID=2774190 RepID=A0A975C3T3_9CAUL|nr:IlvD/Edd family dehydratase [Brevundimonas goettingensis]QTC91939.1 dihydroxy-acid dehydratase [Brevundimonas goettingensis]